MIIANRVFLQIFGSFGKVGCSIFALISGYYLVTSESGGVSKKHFKRILPLVGKMVFYSWTILAVVAFTGIVPLSAFDIIKALIPNVWGNWYLRYYILFFLFTPYINILLQKLDYKAYTGLVILLLIIWSLVPTLTNGIWDFGYFDFFVVMYIIGGYIRLYLGEKITQKVALLGFLCSAVTFVGIILVIDYIGIKTNSDFIINHATYFAGYSSFFSVALSVFTFILFTKFYFSNRIINSISKSIIGIYLLHDNDLLRNIVWNVLLPGSSVKYYVMIHALIKVCAVFLLCFVIEEIRSIAIDKYLIGFIKRKARKSNDSKI